MPWYELKKSQPSVDIAFDGIHTYTLCVSDRDGEDLVHLSVCPDSGEVARESYDDCARSSLMVHADRKPRIGKWKKVKQ